MYKEKYKIKCACGKTVLSVDNSKTLCNKCLAWNKPGKGQTNLFGEVIK
jgi:hypothetical protein